MKREESIPPIFSVTRMTNKAKVFKMGESFADKVLENLTPESRITGLTNGAFSLLSLIHSTLKVTGSAHVVISTWSAGLYDATDMKSLIEEGKMLSFRLILDNSFKNRKQQYSYYFEDTFRPENIRTSNMHAKFVLISNDSWRVTILSSMNINENRRSENFDINTDPEIFRLFSEFSDRLFSIAPEGINTEKDNEEIFNSLFDDVAPSEPVPVKPSTSIFNRKYLE